MENYEKDPALLEHRIRNIILNYTNTNNREQKVEWMNGARSQCRRSVVRKPVGSSQRLKHWHLLLPWNRAGVVGPMWA